MSTETKTWVHVVAGVVVGAPFPLSAEHTPGKDVLVGLDGFVETTGISPAPQEGWQYDGNAFTPAVPPELTGAELIAFQSLLCVGVDRKAEDLRLTLITPGSGQAMEYQESYAQAKAALAQDAAHTADPTKPPVSAADYPMLAVTIGYDRDPSTGKPAADVLGVARSVKAAYEAYLAAGSAIKGIRTEAKALIRATASRLDAEAAAAAVVWPTFG